MTHVSSAAEPPGIGEPPAVGDSTPLFTRAIGNTFWLLNSSIFVRLLNLARGIILARLLVPDDFGLFGLAGVVIGFTAMFSDVGAGVFLIYRQDKVEDHVDTAFWLNLLFATGLSGLVAASAPVVGAFYQRPDLVPVLVLMALALWLQMVSTVHRNLLRRELRFRAVAGIDAVFGAVLFAVAVVLAWRGFGVWAFVLSTLAGNLVQLLLLLIVLRWWPRWRFSRESFRDLAPFSGWYVGQALLWYLVFNVDNLAVGKFLGIPALGIYGLAYNYALLPLTIIANPIGNVVFAELPRLLSEPQRFWPAYFQFSRAMAFIGSPLALLLVVTAPDFFPLVFGNKWEGAVVPFQVLAVYAAIRGLWIDPFAALGRFDLGARLAAVTSVVLAVGIFSTVRFGITGVACAVLVIVGSAHVAALWICTRSAARWIEGLRQVAPYLLSAAFAAALGAGTRKLFWLWLPDRRVVSVLLTATTVLCVYGWLQRAHLKTMANYLPALRAPLFRSSD